MVEGAETHAICMDRGSDTGKRDRTGKPARRGRSSKRGRRWTAASSAGFYPPEALDRGNGRADARRATHGRDEDEGWRIARRQDDRSGPTPYSPPSAKTPQSARRAPRVSPTSCGDITELSARNRIVSRPARPKQRRIGRNCHEGSRQELRGCRS